MIPYFNIDLKITIAEKYVFNVAETIHIENSTEKISDIAKVTLPREFKQLQESSSSISIERKRLLDFIKVGDKIKIEAGYDGKLGTEFEGYITRIGAEIPIELECEDEMYQLKKMKTINKTFSNVSLKKFLQEIAPGYEIKTFETQLGKIAFENVTPFMALQEIKSKYPFKFFFRGKVLYAGLSHDFENQEQHEFNLNRNVRKGGDLKYATKEDRKVWVKAISMQKGSSKEITYEFGDKGESERTLHCPLNLNKEQLKQYAEDFIKKLRYDGYGGGFESWCYPRTIAGDSANLTDPNYPDKHRDGIYFINEVITNINASDGIKRKNNITFKIK
ncbi:hypothetical protein [Amniculibacterium sp. G2-70]|uniref:hypothetical protein n=1 Tax=Amniculibacterium sp. G2-70 TaxID=2767188 RepID=UPI001654391B|nr:hypothetical protein [Amniculibacterium sp. G2-70]